MCWVLVATCRIFSLLQTDSEVAVHGLQRAQASVVAAHGLYSCSEGCGILVPQPGIEPPSPAWQGGLNHWVTRELPRIAYLWGGATAWMHEAVDKMTGFIGIIGRGVGQGRERNGICVWSQFIKWFHVFRLESNWYVVILKKLDIRVMFGKRVSSPPLGCWWRWCYYLQVCRVCPVSCDLHRPSLTLTPAWGGFDH